GAALPGRIERPSNAERVAHEAERRDVDRALLAVLGREGEAERVVEPNRIVGASRTSRDVMVGGIERDEENVVTPGKTRFAERAGTDRAGARGGFDPRGLGELAVQSDRPGRARHA